MPDEIQIARLFASAFSELDALRQRNPSAASQIAENIAAHLRSSAPLAFVPVDPRAEVVRVLRDGSRYRVHAAGDCIVLTLSHPDAAFEADEARVLRCDVASVTAAVGGKL